MNALIYNQNHIPKDQYRYGFRASADTGCGWVATHNALCIMGYQTDIKELIRYYEWQLPLIHGNAGTSFWGPALCFRNWGFPVEIGLQPKQFGDVAQRSDACILFYRWQKGYKLGTHFVALKQDGERITGYNTFSNSVGPDNWGGSVDGFMKKNHFFGGVLIGIKDKR